MNADELRRFAYEAYHAVIELEFAVLSLQPRGTPMKDSVRKALDRGNAIIARWEGGNRIKREPESEACDD